MTAAIHIDPVKLAALWTAGKSVSAIAEVWGVSTGMIYSRAKDMGLPTRRGPQPVDVAGAKMRKCLSGHSTKCPPTFWSRGPGNRICPDCAKWTSGAYTVMDGNSDSGRRVGAAGGVG
jgi:hypothetical protein